MKKFAVIENEIVVNTIIAQSKAIAEELTGNTCVEFTIEPAEPGGTYAGGKFIKRKPFPSWVTDGDADWLPPVERPEFDKENPKSYVWDEETISWLEFPWVRELPSIN
jgi:hypothetical protein